MGNGSERKTCFVVMGFGEKTDYQSNPQRVLNLNRTFEDIIEPAVTASGLECIRADKIIHSTVIDKPMYEHLLTADLVIADLSTSNANAIYELGVRHALRPHTTIVMAEQKFAFPFDLNHLLILTYEHLGKEIGYREVMRMRTELETRIAAILAREETDSPVFLFLPQLLGRSRGEPAPEPAPMAARQDDKSLAELLDLFKQAKKDVRVAADWLMVVVVLKRLQKLQPADPYIVQQLALATYKSKQPDAVTALRNARTILEELKPDTSSDAETVGLWGAIHKRLWEETKDRAALDRAIRSYARGYFIRDDHYNGINFAFLLNVRAAQSAGDEATADRVLARRIRGEVLELCDTALAAAGAALAPPVTGADNEATFWLLATKVEALLGAGRKAEAEALEASIAAYVPPPHQWMLDTMRAQLATLEQLNP
jgi:hypothetical protein